MARHAYIPFLLAVKTKQPQYIDIINLKLYAKVTNYSHFHKKQIGNSEDTNVNIKRLNVKLFLNCTIFVYLKRTKIIN